MQEKWQKESSFHSVSDDWYGRRLYFEQKTRWKKEVLEVTLYAGEEESGFRYMVHHGFWLSYKEGKTANYKDDALPFWVRKVLFLFVS